MKTVTCSCGYIASGETAEELLADVETHIEVAHRPASGEVVRPAQEAGDVSITTTKAEQ